MPAAGETVIRQFITRHPTTKVPEDADSLPSAVFIRNGADTPVECVVTHQTTGVYNVEIPIPATYLVGDEVEVRLTATVDLVLDSYILRIGEIESRITAEEVAAATAAATAVYPTGTAYVTSEVVEDYLSGSLKSSKWTAAPPADKNAAIINATRIINRLNFRGYPAAVYHAREAGSTEVELRALAEQQDLAFPRNDDTFIPRDITDACCEIAFALIDGFDPQRELRAAATVSETIGPLSVRSTYDRSQPLEWVAAGVPSPIAWQLLRPYLRDTRSVRVNRAERDLI